MWNSDGLVFTTVPVDNDDGIECTGKCTECELWATATTTNRDNDQEQEPRIAVNNQ